ncbi:octanoyltransferase [Bacteroidetes/Chlorobi group bacterium ChocPot_Mid]|jgi:lipoate-protein ligase A|nr:MAG: octanoyltransferase [Bacteroidetes/Chlorobi group bacterium ChocPot_Mid]
MKKIIKNTEINELYSSEFELITDDFLDGQFNMDFDFNRTQSLAEGKALPMLRFYGWNPWTISLGFNQKEDDIDPVLLEQKGFGLVRRPTGGRAVLHADELTYSVVMSLPESMSVHDVYREIHKILLSGLKNLGESNLDFEKSQTDFRDFYKKQPGMSVSCFASAARYEIALDGRKVVGSAQRLFGNVLLQHGSILLGPGHEQISEIIKTDNPQKRVMLKNYILSHSATLSDAFNRKITFSEAMDSIINQFIR